MTKIFLVSGRDRAARDALEKLLRSWGLEVIDWEGAIEATEDAAPHARQVLDAGFNKAQVAVVLFTGDEVAMLRHDLCADHERETEGVLAPQPRQNVLVEAGIALALFPRRTVFVQIGRLRAVSDLAGVQTVVLDWTNASISNLWRRLKIAGCKMTKPAHDAPPDAAAWDADLPDVSDANQARTRGSIAILARLRSKLPFAQMGGQLTICDHARAGDVVVISSRIDGHVDDVQILHWRPGAAVAVSRSITQGANDSALYEVEIELPPIAGRHVFDLRLDGELVSRATCEVEVRA